MDDVFVGRVDEQEVGRSLLQRAREGRPRPLLVTGAPGIGKSSLLARLASDADRSGFRAIVVPADRVDSAVPYAALRLTLEPLLADESDPSLVAATAALSDVLARRSPPNLPRPERHALLQRVVEGWAFRSPVLLAVDDLHDADDDTAAGVLHLMRHVRAHRVQIAATTSLATALDSPVSVGIDALTRAGSLEVVAVAPLTEDELTELVQQRTGYAPTARLVQLLLERSGGTPFFVIELLDAMARSADLAVGRGRVDATGDGPPMLPRRVSTAVLHRIFGLGPDARAVASACAVVGQVPNGARSLLVAVTGLCADRVADAFDELVRAGVIAEDGGRYRFVHAIVRDAVYDDIGPAARRRLHGRAADALRDGGSASGVDVAEIAGHVLRSTAGRDLDAAQLLADAGRSLGSTNPRAAAVMYRGALARLGPRDADVVDVQLDLAGVLDIAGDHDDAARVARAVLATVTDPPRRRRAVTRAARALVNGGHWQQAVELLDGALDDPALRTPALLLHQAQTLLWTERRGEVPALVAEARRHGDAHDDAIADALDMHDAVATGRLTTAVRLHDRLHVRLTSLPPSSQFSIRLSLCAVSAFNLDPADALAITDLVDDAAPLSDWFRSIGAWATYRQGRFGDVGQRAGDIHDALDRLDGDLSTGLRLAASLASLVERAEPGAADVAVAASRAQTIPIFETGVDVARAMWHRQRGEHDIAAGLLAAAEERERTRGQLNLLVLAQAHAVDAALDRGDEHAAKAANERLQERADGAGVAVTMHALLARAAAEGDVAAAQEARDHAMRHGLLADAGRALGLVGALTTDGQILAAAYRELGELGAVWRQRAVAHELRRLGLRVPQGPLDSSELSPVEVEVVSLVSTGLTNRQIAERMALSPKTVEVYLSRIYVKTGSRSRVELAIAARGDSLG